MQRDAPATIATNREGIISDHALDTYGYRQSCFTVYDLKGEAFTGSVARGNVQAKEVIEGVHGAWDHPDAFVEDRFNNVTQPPCV